MKTLILSIITLLVVGVCYGQESKIDEFNDLDIAKALIGKKVEKVEDIIKHCNVEYWVTKNNEGKMFIFITYSESIRAWKLNIGDVYSEIAGNVRKVGSNIVTEVHIRYRHNNMNDLRHFYLYEKPEDEQHRKFEKELGQDVSHFKIIQF